MVSICALALSIAAGGLPFEGGADGAAALDEALDTRAADGRFAGVVAVARGGELVHLAAFGEADVERGVPHDAGTRFKLHSLAKPLLATVLLRGVDAERVALDDLVGEHLPDWPLAWSEVTLRHLATHTSGVPDLAESFLDEWSGSALATWEAIAGGVAGRDLAFAPGEGWAYSNGGYVLLTAVLEAAWEKPFAELLEQELTGPAGMGATELEREPVDGASGGPRGLATGYNGSPTALEVAHSRTYAIPGAGGIVSDAGDLVAFAHALFEGDLLSDDARRSMTTVAEGQSVPYALGWVVSEREGRPVYRHDGGNNGFVTSLEYYPRSRLTIVLLCNRGYVPLGEVRDEVAELVLRDL